MSLWLCLCLVMSLFTPQGVANQTTVSYASEAAYVKTGGADLNMRSEPKKAGSVLVKIPNGSRSLTWRMPARQMAITG